MLAVAASLPAVPPERAAVIAEAIHSATLEATCTGPFTGADWCSPIWPSNEPALLIGSLIKIGKDESGFLERVGAGRCRPEECDPLEIAEGVFVHRARHYWQCHSSRLVPEWDELVGVEYWPTRQAAYAAARVLGAAYKRCGSLEGALALYATGRKCVWSGADDRARAARRIERRLREP